MPNGCSMLPVDKYRPPITLLTTPFKPPLKMAPSYPLSLGEKIIRGEQLNIASCKLRSSKCLAESGSAGSAEGGPTDAA